MLGGGATGGTIAGRGGGPRSGLVIESGGGRVGLAAWRPGRAGIGTATSGLPPALTGAGGAGGWRGAGGGVLGGSIATSLSGIAGTTETWVRGDGPGGIGGAMLDGLARAPKLGGGSVLGRSAGDAAGVGIPATALIDARGTGIGGCDGSPGRSIGISPPVPPWSGRAGPRG